MVDYDARVVDYWPEFGAHGKDLTTVRDALTHRAGIPQMPPGVTAELMCDWEWMVDAVADLTPMYPPGTTSAYHSLVYGWIIGEIAHRVDPDHRDFGRMAGEMSAPLGIEDLWLGLPASELPRCRPRLTARRGAVREVTPDADRVAPNAPVHNRADVMEACIPGAGAIMSAPAGARFFAMLANGGELDGVRLLSEEHVRLLTTPRANSDELDRNMAGGGVVAPQISIGGYWLTDPVGGPGPNMLCHGGSGGSIGWADLDRRLGAQITHNRMFDTMGPYALPEHAFTRMGDALRKVADTRGVGVAGDATH